MITDGRDARGPEGERLVSPAPLRVAVLIPCFNEEAAIGAVVRDFRSALRSATVYVYDNLSTDATAQVARDAGAVVRTESRRGKGHVVCRMFGEVEADVYVLVDGDGTYDAMSAPHLLKALVVEGADMVCGARVPATAGQAYPPGHRFGNTLLTGIVARLFGRGFTDMLTGYRVLSRRFVKSFPALSSGFEIETQITVHALEMQMRVAEYPTRYRERTPGSESKLRTWHDGWRILLTIFDLLKAEKPLAFFFTLFAALAAASIGLAIPVFAEYIRTGLVPRFPTAILSTGMMLLGFLFLAVGLILDMVAHGRREMKRLHYLLLPPVPTTDAVAPDP